MTRSKSGRPRRLFWTPEEDALLREIYPDATAAECSRRIGRTKASVFQRARLLGLEKSEAFFLSDRSGRVQRGKQNPAMAATQFKKGIKPWNTGTKGVAAQHPNCVVHRFQKGTKNGRALAVEQPIGAERVAEGVLQIKVNNNLPFPSRWQALHGLVWEATQGPIPPGHKVVFRPGQHTTVAELITLDRLELVTHAELMRRNSYHNRYPKEVGLLIQMKGQITRKINRRSEELNEKQD
jgi:hypothetical protein